MGDDCLTFAQWSDVVVDISGRLGALPVARVFVEEFARAIATTGIRGLWTPAEYRELAKLHAGTVAGRIFAALYRNIIKLEATWRVSA